MSVNMTQKYVQRHRAGVLPSGRGANFVVGLDSELHCGRFATLRQMIDSTSHHAHTYARTHTNTHTHTHTHTRTHASTHVQSPPPPPTDGAARCLAVAADG